MTESKNGRSPRSVALVGSYSSGKSTLFEALMDAAGTAVNGGVNGNGSRGRGS